MKDFYIKSGKKFCVLYKHPLNVNNLLLVQFLIEQNIITQSAVIDAFNELKSHATLVAPFTYHYLDGLGYSTSATKNNSHDTKSFSLEYIKDTFLTIEKLEKAQQILNDEVMKHLDYVKKIKSFDFKNYFDYEAYINKIALMTDKSLVGLQGEAYYKRLKETCLEIASNNVLV